MTTTELVKTALEQLAGDLVKCPEIHSADDKRCNAGHAFEQSVYFVQQFSRYTEQSKLMRRGMTICAACLAELLDDQEAEAERQHMAYEASTERAKERYMGLPAEIVVGPPDDGMVTVRMSVEDWHSIEALIQAMVTVAQRRDE